MELMSTYNRIERLLKQLNANHEGSIGLLIYSDLSYHITRDGAWIPFDEARQTLFPELKSATTSFILRDLAQLEEAVGLETVDTPTLGQYKELQRQLEEAQKSPFKEGDKLVRTKGGRDLGIEADEGTEGTFVRAVEHANGDYYLEVKYTDKDGATCIWSCSPSWWEAAPKQAPYPYAVGTRVVAIKDGAPDKGIRYEAGTLGVVAEARGVCWDDGTLTAIRVTFMDDHRSRTYFVTPENWTTTKP